MNTYEISIKISEEHGDTPLESFVTIKKTTEGAILWTDIAVNGFFPALQGLGYYFELGTEEGFTKVVDKLEGAVFS